MRLWTSCYFQLTPSTRSLRSLPGRTDQQCMGRWRRHLDPSVNKAGWHRAEDELLRALVGEHGAAWSQISRFLPGRTPQQVRARWCQLEGADSTPASTQIGRAHV